MASMVIETDAERRRKNQLLGTPGKHDETYYQFNTFDYDVTALIGHYSRNPPKSKYYYRMAYNAMARTEVTTAYVNDIINRQAYWALRGTAKPCPVDENDRRALWWLDSSLMPSSGAGVCLESTLLRAREAEAEEKAARGRELGARRDSFKEWQTPVPTWAELYDDQKRRPHSHELVTLPTVAAATSSPTFSIDLFCEEAGVDTTTADEEEKEMEDTQPYGNQEQQRQQPTEEEWGSDIEDDHVALEEVDYCNALREVEAARRKSLTADMAHANVQKIVDKAIARDGKISYELVNRMREMDEKKRRLAWEYEIAAARVQLAEEKITLDVDEKALAMATIKMATDKAIGVSVIQWAMSGKLPRDQSLKRKAEAEEEWGYFSSGE